MLIVGLRSLLGPAKCQFEIGCTMFAVTQLKSEPLPTAVRNIAFRLIRCSPLTYFFRSK